MKRPAAQNIVHTHKIRTTHKHTMKTVESLIPTENRWRKKLKRVSIIRLANDNRNNMTYNGSEFTQYTLHSRHRMYFQIDRIEEDKQISWNKARTAPHRAPHITFNIDSHSCSSDSLGHHYRQWHIHYSFYWRLFFFLSSSLVCLSVQYGFLTKVSCYAQKRLIFRWMQPTNNRDMTFLNRNI